MSEFSTAQRLKQIMNERNLKQIDIINLAKPYCEKYKLKIGRNDLSQYVSGKVIPRQNKTYVLARALDVNEAWLMGYDVPRERNKSYDNLPSTDINILYKYHKLNKKGQQKTESYIDDLLENPNYTKKEERPVTDNEPSEKIKLAARNGKEINEEEFKKNIGNTDDLADADDL